MRKRDNYLNLIHPFYNKKIINSIRKSEKSTLLLHLIEDLKSNGVEDNQIIHLKLDLVERQFRTLLNIIDQYPKYVLSMDKINFSKEGIIHKNIFDFLLE